MNETTRFRWIYFLKQKSNVSNVIKTFLIMIEIQTNQKIKRWHSDNEEEFFSKVMTKIVISNEIVHEFTTFYDSEQNDFVEKSMHTI